LRFQIFLLCLQVGPPISVIPVFFHAPGLLSTFSTKSSLVDRHPASFRFIHKIVDDHMGRFVSLCWPSGPCCAAVNSWAASGLSFYDSPPFFPCPIPSSHVGCFPAGPHSPFSGPLMPGPPLVSGPHHSAGSFTAIFHAPLESNFLSTLFPRVATGLSFVCFRVFSSPHPFSFFEALKHFSGQF